MPSPIGLSGAAGNETRLVKGANMNISLSDLKKILRTPEGAEFIYDHFPFKRELLSHVHALRADKDLLFLIDATLPDYFPADLQAAQDKGCVEVGQDLLLYTQKAILELRKKEGAYQFSQVDFTTAPYWLTTSDDVQGVSEQGLLTFAFLSPEAFKPLCSALNLH